MSNSALEELLADTELDADTKKQPTRASGYGGGGYSGGCYGAKASSSSSDGGGGGGRGFGGSGAKNCADDDFDSLLDDVLGETRGSGDGSRQVRASGRYNGGSSSLREPPSRSYSTGSSTTGSIAGAGVGGSSSVYGRSASSGARSVACSASSHERRYTITEEASNTSP